MMWSNNGTSLSFLATLRANPKKAYSTRSTVLPEPFNPMNPSAYSPHAYISVSLPAFYSVFHHEDSEHKYPRGRNLPWDDIREIRHPNSKF